MKYGLTYKSSDHRLIRSSRTRALKPKQPQRIKTGNKEVEVKNYRRICDGSKTS